MEFSKQFRIVARASEARVFHGNGATELVVHLPSFATGEDREEMRRMLIKIGTATRRQFLESAPAFNSLGLKVQADDEDTLNLLALARNAVNAG